jgi:hypothetical protein
MRISIIVIFIAVAGFAGEWTYRCFFRAVDPLQPEVLALAEHFKKTGIEVNSYAARHGFLPRIGPLTNHLSSTEKQRPPNERLSR